MSRAEIDRLRDIVEAMDGAESAVGGLTLDVFVDADTPFAALCYYVLVVSEASRHISAERKASFPEIEWREIADTGNFVRHVYFKVNRTRVWKIYENDFPKLRPVIESMIRDFPRDL